MPFLAILTKLGQLTRKGDLTRLRNRSKSVERSLFAIIDLLQAAKSIVLYFLWRVGDDFHQKIFKFQKKKVFHLFYFD